MAKTTAPLLSFGASGQVAKAQVYATWRGVPYARRYVVPANPNSAAQQTTRNTFRTQTEMWKIAPALLVAPWNAFATGRPFLGRNAYIGQNTKALRGETDMNKFIGSPGARGGLPPSTMTAAATVNPGEIDVSFTNPTAPTGWTLDSAIAVTFEDQDPALAFASALVADEDATTQNSILFTGLTGGAVHQVAGWLKWTKPDGQVAYSASLIAQATPAS